MHIITCMDVCLIKVFYWIPNKRKTFFGLFLSMQDDEDVTKSLEQQCTLAVILSVHSLL